MISGKPVPQSRPPQSKKTGAEPKIFRVDQTAQGPV
jgi:hypothetical protein